MSEGGPLPNQYENMGESFGPWGHRILFLLTLTIILYSQNNIMNILNQLQNSMTKITELMNFHVYILIHTIIGPHKVQKNLILEYYNNAKTPSFDIKFSLQTSA